MPDGLELPRISYVTPSYNQEDLLRNSSKFDTEGYIVGNIGNIDDDRFVKLVFNAAELYVIPSLVDYLPLVAIVALTRGPLLSVFNAGGVLDQVRSNGN